MCLAIVVGQTGDVIILLELHIFMSWPAHVLFMYKQWNPEGPSGPGRVSHKKLTLWRDRERKREQEIHPDQNTYLVN